MDTFPLPLCSLHLASVHQDGGLPSPSLWGVVSQHTWRYNPGLCLSLLWAAPPSSAPAPTGRPFCNKRRWVNKAFAPGDWLRFNRGCVPAFSALRPTSFNHCTNWFRTLKHNCLFNAFIDSIPASQAGGLAATQSLFWLGSPQWHRGLPAESSFFHFFCWSLKNRPINSHSQG